ncbi:MAG: YdiU family protein [Bdellovibrionales bacterium]|nr:YdiU family protein [Bdellovibrionales bacterium]
MKSIFSRAQHSYAQLPQEFYQKISPQVSTEPKLIEWNQPLATFLGIELDDASLRQRAQVFSGNLQDPKSIPLAMAYSGHQFGHFNPGLGDGRAHVLVEVSGEDGKIYDIQLKGSGRTQFSRGGDGRSPLGPVIREYLISEAMHALGIPTTRSLAAVETGDLVYREQPLAGGIFTRVAQSLIRIGSFEHFAARGQVKHLKILLEYVVKRSYPELDPRSDHLPLEFFTALSERQARLVAKWMGLGFIHGVMNTDNSSAIGITIDYGPCAFMDEFDEKKVFSSIDHYGRYAYQNQAVIMQWNLASLARALLLLYPESEQESAAQTFELKLQDFMACYQEHYARVMSMKLGLEEKNWRQHRELIKIWMSYLQKHHLDFTLSFRNLDFLLSSEASFPQDELLKEFVKVWKAQLFQEEESIEKITKDLHRSNPLYIPRNHKIEQVIESAYQGDHTPFREMLGVLSRPFTQQEGKESYSQSPKKEERITATFCGT